MATATNVTAGKPKIAGAVSVAALGTTLPTTADEALAAGFANLGYISDAGLTNDNARTVDEIKAWGGDVVLTVQSEKTDTFSTVLIETLNVDVMKAVYGDENVSGDLTNGITVNVNAQELEEKSWIVDMIMRNGVLKRIVIPNGKITTTEAITYADNDVTGYGITLTAYPDANGNTHYEYIKG